jgi:hypothetical protein
MWTGLNWPVAGFVLTVITFHNKGIFFFAQQNKYLLLKDNPVPRSWFGY